MKMPQLKVKGRKAVRRVRHEKSKPNRLAKPGKRYSVGLPSALANQVERYAETVDTSVSKSIAALVRLGLDSQLDRKREFFKKLKENIANDDPKEQDRLVDEFRALILGR